ncbi:hypothetical protein EMGBD1_18120 [Anaerolineaceae bacterium]|nr:hypothetical protein EMGBD1_18120 [Anaerolineaceae bacterium]
MTGWCGVCLHYNSAMVNAAGGALLAIGGLSFFYFALWHHSIATTYSTWSGALQTAWVAELISLAVATVGGALLGYRKDGRGGK